MNENLLNDLERRMNSSIDVLKKEFQGLRTGRATASLLEPITVEAYGSELPINQVATISAPEVRMLNVQVWDQSQIQTVEKAIQNANLGLNPIIDGQILRIPIPELNEERRIELAKVAAKYTEESRIAIRNIRRDGIDKLKKDGGIAVYDLGGGTYDISIIEMTNVDGEYQFEVISTSGDTH